jgi:hypothetical protein
MKRLCLLILLVCCVGCSAAVGASDYRDDVAVDLAVATMADSPAPTPGPTPDKCGRCKGTGWITHGDGHRTPCPDCQGDAGASFGGPLDTLRDAKELIRKGSDLADRSKAILDQAQRDGKVTVDIRVPQSPPTQAVPTPSQAGGRACQGGFCPLVPDSPSPSTEYPGGVSRPRLFGRFRR